MKISTLRRTRATDPAVVGVARLARDSAGLTKRLRPGDIAVIDHTDLDRGTAEGFVARGVVAVVNASRSSSGRFPNLGPEVLVSAGIPLVDEVGRGVFGAVKDGERIRIEGGIVSIKDRQVAEGELLDLERVQDQMSAARSGLSTQLESFAANTAAYIQREHDVLLDGVGIPDVTTTMRDRHVVVVVGGRDHSAELRSLRRYVGDYDPVLLGVDSGADTLLEAGFAPDLVLGEVETLSDRALTCGAEIVLHHQRGVEVSTDRLDKLQVTSTAFPVTGSSEDAALLLADHAGSSLVVAVGTHANLVEFLDRGRAGMASTFLTRLKLDTRLVDAGTVVDLYRSRLRTWHILLLLVAALAAVAVAVWSTPVGHDWLAGIDHHLTAAIDWVQDLIP